MPANQTTLITGASGYWGQRVANRLLLASAEKSAGTATLRVLGIDRRPPQTAIPGLDFVQADFQNPLIGKLLAAEAIDTVLHLDFLERTSPSESAFEHNVMGTMRFFGMCAEAGVRRIILRSSTVVYGARPGNSLFLPEEHPLRYSRSYGYSRHWGEVEEFCQNFGRNQPQISLTVLRFASILGPTVDSPMARFLRDHRAPSLLGFNPMMQIVHEQDVVDALVYAAREQISGTWNIAAEPVLPLNKLIARSGKVPLPILHPLAYAAVSVRGRRHFPVELDYLRYPWVASVEKMQRELGWEPVFSAEEAIESFVAHQRVRRYMPDPVARMLDRSSLREFLERSRPQDSGEADESI